MTSHVMPKKAPGGRPTVALGAMNFGKRTTADESERIVRRAIERGIVVFDTANFYNAGVSERILGRALGSDRHRVVLSTKAGLGLVPGKPEGLSPLALRNAFEASIERLGTDVVDVYYLHVPDRATPIERTLEAMKSLLASDRVRSWGVSNYAAWEILEINHVADAQGMPRPAVTQLLYNTIHRELDVEYFAFARRYPIHTTVYNALAGGLLTGRHRFDQQPASGSRFDANVMYKRRYWTPAMFARVEQLRAVAIEEGCSLAALSYSWLAASPDVDSILVGAATVEQVDEALDGISHVLSDTSRRYIDELARAWSGTDTHYVR